MRDRETGSKSPEGCGGGARLLEWEVLVYLTRVFQKYARAVCTLRPTRDGPSFCVAAVVRVLFGQGEGSA